MPYKLHNFLVDTRQILSIAKALPLQIHPDKDLAARLHEKNPDQFGDTNHKPEIAVALGKFEVFVGWLPLPEVQHLFTSIPVLKSNFLTPDSKSPFDHETLKHIVYNILSASDEQIVKVYRELTSLPAGDFGKNSYIPELLPRLAEQYDKSDPGNLVALLAMNFMVLQKGEAIYVPAEYVLKTPPFSMFNTKIMSQRYSCLSIWRHR